MRPKIIFVLAVHLTSTFFPYYISIPPKDSLPLALPAPLQIGIALELPKRPPYRQAEPLKEEKIKTVTGLQNKRNSTQKESEQAS